MAGRTAFIVVAAVVTTTTTAAAAAVAKVVEEAAGAAVVAVVLKQCRMKGYWLVGWMLNAPATCKCISGTDLLRQFHVLPH